MGQSRTASSYGTAPLKRGLVGPTPARTHTHPPIARIRANQWRRARTFAVSGLALLAIVSASIDETSAVRFGLRPRRDLFDAASEATNAVYAVRSKTSSDAVTPPHERTDTPMISSLSTVSLAEANAYLKHAGGDEIAAAYELARHRNVLDGAKNPPDDTEVHHALFLLRKAFGRSAPSFDEMRVELRRRVAA